MAPFYTECCNELNWKIDTGLLEKMKQENDSKLKVYVNPN
jgi:hypothetical protein